MCFGLQILIYATTAEVVGLRSHVEDAFASMRVKICVLKKIICLIAQALTGLIG